MESQLKAFSMIKRMILTSWTKTFLRRFRLEIKVDSPRRPVRDISELNFDPNTHFFNLSLEEKAALENIVNVADKSSSLVVWWADL